LNFVDNCGDWIYSDEPTTCGDDIAGSNLRVDCAQYQSLYDITGLNAKKFYNIRIAAKNKCGLSDESLLLEAETNFCPTKVEDPITKISGANVNVIWANQ